MAASEAQIVRYVLEGVAAGADMFGGDLGTLYEEVLECPDHSKQSDPVYQRKLAMKLCPQVFKENF